MGNFRLGQCNNFYGQCYGYVVCYNYNVSVALFKRELDNIAIGYGYQNKGLVPNIYKQYFVKVNPLT